MKVPSVLSGRALRDDASAGFVLGVESVPSGLATGLLAAVNPVAGLYACLYGMAGGAIFASSAFMAVQSTSAMGIIVADVHLGRRDDPAAALFTLSVLTGIVMIVAGLLRLGFVLRFVSASVMTGFVTAVGINIVLGQLPTLSGYDAKGSNRIAKTLDLLLHLGDADGPSLVVGLVTIVVIAGLGRTRVGALGMVVGVVVGSALAAWFGHGHEVQTLGDLVDVPGSLPGLRLPSLRELPGLLVPAVSLAFVGLVQGAGVTAGFPNPDGSFPDPSRDFLAQGAGNVASGLFQGMPVGGSMSASALVVNGGARSRASLLIAAVVMAVVILAFAPLVGHTAMPSLAGLLIVLGVSTIKPANIRSIAKTGPGPLAVMVTTLVLTLVIPLQYAVLVGVGFSIVLHVVQQSSRVVIRQLVPEGGQVRETEPPRFVPGDAVVVLQPYGSMFFAAAPTFERQLPEVTPDSGNSVVILRLRGADDLGATAINVLQRYAAALGAVGSRFVVVTDNRRIPRQLQVTGATDAIGADNVYLGSELVGATVRRAHADATAWVRRSEQG